MCKMHGNSKLIINKEILEVLFKNGVRIPLLLPIVNQFWSDGSFHHESHIAWN